MSMFQRRSSTLAACLLALVALVTPPPALASTAPPRAAVPAKAWAAAAGTMTAAAAPTVAGSFTAVAPSRILDTRTGLGAAGPVPATGSVAVTVLGAGGIPATGVSAVALNVTVTRALAPGYITVYPDDSIRPVASSLSFWAGQTIPNLVVVPVGDNGKVRVFNGSAGTAALVADVAGFFLTGAPGITPVGGSFQPVAPKRLLDTRIGLGAAASPVAGNSSLSLQISGAAGLPTSGIAAVALTVTVTRPTASGYLTVYPEATARPGVSSLDFTVSRTVPNLVVVPLGSLGRIRLFNGSPGSVALIADVAGYFRAGTPGVAGAFQPVTPTRLLDTRIGLGAPAGAVPGNSSITVKLAGTGALPVPGVAGAVVNVTAVAPYAAGVVTVYANGTAQPKTSNLNFVGGQTVANLVMVPLGSDGRIRIYNSSGGSVQLLADVVGFYLDGSGAAQCNAIASDPNGTSVTRWNPVVQCILNALHQSTGNVADVDTIIRYESGGDPNAINLTDINAQNGHPSIGLVQVIKSTFETYRSPQLPDNQYNPAANLYAGMNYAIQTYGSIHDVPGLVSLRNGGGYVGYVVHR
ncbi:hypothetical protein ABIB25_004348 [Nakamurella sp. UYEF19]|uniref:transglycosylase SLT domain-containing protein n=1 Tax=Nakamurella sp. UYEF19 TaxID=1756392 RepID=UPI003393181C